MSVATAQDSFADLMHMVQNGHDDAMGELARRYGPGLLPFAEQMLGGPLRARFDADDVVQSTLITMWLGIRAGKFVVTTPESLSALARTVLRRQVARLWREAKFEINSTIDGNLSGTLADEDLFVGRAEADPGRIMELDEQLELFVADLAPIDRRLVRLRYHGYSTVEAAVALQTDPGTLRVRLSRLRRKFADFRHQLAAHA